MADPPRIRPARRDDHELKQLRGVEVRAGTLFADIGMHQVAEDEPPAIADLRAAHSLLVAVDRDDRPVGYARVEIVDGHAHLEQLSVDPAVGRRGIGAALVEAVVDVARDRGDREVTLTTFRRVAFNAPYYERHGFAPVPETERSAALVALVDAEAAHGLDPAERVVMRRSVRDDGGPPDPA